MSGLDIVGIAANIIQIADLGTKLSVKLFTFYRQVQSVNQSVQSLASDVALTSAILHELGKSLEQDEADKLCSDQAHGMMQIVMKECADVLHQIQDEIHDPDTPGKSRWQKATGKLRNVLNESNVNFLKEKLETLKRNMLLLLNVIMCAGQIRNNNVSKLLHEQRGLIEKLLEEQKLLNQEQHQPLKIVLPRTGLHGPNINVFTASINSNPVSSDKNELEEYDALIQKMLHEIDCCKLKLDNARHSRIRGGVLTIHSNEIVQFQRTHGPSIFTHFEDSLFDSSEPTTKPKSTYVSEKQSNSPNGTGMRHGWEFDKIQAFRSKANKPSMTESTEMSGDGNEEQNFGDNEFAAIQVIAAEAQSVRLDSSVATSDPKYHARASPPRLKDGEDDLMSAHLKTSGFKRAEVDQEEPVVEESFVQQDSTPVKEKDVAEKSAKAVEEQTVVSEVTEQEPVAKSETSALVEQSSTTDETTEEFTDDDSVYGALLAGLRPQDTWMPGFAFYKATNRGDSTQKEGVISKVEQAPQGEPAEESTKETVLTPEVLTADLAANEAQLEDFLLGDSEALLHKLNLPCTDQTSSQYLPRDMSITEAQPEKFQEPVTALVESPMSKAPSRYDLIQTDDKLQVRHIQSNDPDVSLSLWKRTSLVIMKVPILVRELTDLLMTPPSQIMSRYLKKTLSMMSGALPGYQNQGPFLQTPKGNKTSEGSFLGANSRPSSSTPDDEQVPANMQGSSGLAKGAKLTHFGLAHLHPAP
ncbi:hypothetical protein N7540_000772 [Penicillium herquei]|nr:hypothetical protein N7540_000772 [Penicillium herquei]